MMYAALPDLQTHTIGTHWMHFEQITSTNDYCKTHAETLPHGTAVTASLQTAGKGRLGRHWDAQAEQGLALSVLLHSWSPKAMSLLPLLTGLAVSDGLHRLTGLSCSIKWSNDILFDNKKLCGILCESRLCGDTGAAVIGIGINRTQTNDDFAHLHLSYATSLLLATQHRYSMEETAVAVLNALEPILEQYSAEGFCGTLRRRYCERCITLGQPVRVLYGDTTQTGRALDIEPDGALLCEINGVPRRILAGEASVRGLYGYV